MAGLSATGSSYDARVRLYALANAALLVARTAELERLVLEGLQIPPSQPFRLTISPSSGWVNYSAEGEVWTRSTPPAMVEEGEALRLAEEALTRLERLCSPANSSWPSSLDGIALFPPMALLRRASLHRIPHPEGDHFDHWLYQGEPQLLLDGGAKARAGVFGAQVEVRLGHRGQVVGFCSRWRPLSGERLMVDRTPFQSGGPHHQESGEAREHEDEETSEPMVNFALDGDGVPQFYLAPYYYVADEHAFSVSSASPWSLTVDIGRTRQGEEQMELTALAQGGSGDYLYNWAVYMLEDFEEGLHELGPGRSQTIATKNGDAKISSQTLQNGHYVVLLNVKDRSTGAFKHHQQQVFSSPFPE